MSKSSALPRDNGYFLRAEDITKIYSDGTVAVRDVTVEIHPHEVVGLLGENGAGKTTLTKILSGLLPPPRGRVTSPRGTVRFSSPREALDFGIGMVHQHFALVGTFTAAENVALSHERPFSRVRIAGTKRKLEALMEESGLHVPLDVPVGKLAVGEQQRVEILKVLSRDVELLILDEPTSVLTPLEVDDLFELLRQLRDTDKSIILITHKLKEVQSITDRIVVLRHGELVGDVKTSEATTERLACLMVGQAFEEEADAVELSDEEIPSHKERREADRSGEGVLLHVADLTAKGNTGEIAVEGVSFDVYGGEIFGIAGVEGNGQTELVESLTGLRAPIKGTATINGTNILGKDPREIYRLGVAHIPEDRWELGLVPPVHPGRERDPRRASLGGIPRAALLPPLGEDQPTCAETDGAVRDSGDRTERAGEEPVGRQSAEADRRKGVGEGPRDHRCVSTNSRSRHRSSSLHPSNPD